MEFPIYSLGSAVFMEDILNAVAMISGSGTIESLAMIGLLVGAFILGFKAVYSNTGIQFQQLLVCFVLYLAMYGPTATAIVEDIYTGEVAVVDNVPIGPLAVGSIVSNIGYEVTKAFEQGFSTPSMTSNGFADPLNTLIHVRQIAYNVISLSSMTGNGSNSNLLASWSNYIKECTLVAASSDDRALQKILNDSSGSSGIDALAFASDVYYTKIYDGPADGSTRTCTDAFVALKTMTENAETDLLGDIAKGMTTAGSKPDSFALEARLDDALSSIASGAIDARNFAIMSAVMPILEGGPSALALQDMQGAAAIMMNQAMSQQATQWAAEGSMFTRYIRPFMTFFEGFIYAITPIMAFVIVLGGFGISLVTKYLMILLWMTLWMPILSIINLYALSTTQAKIEALVGGSFTSTGTGLSFNTMRDMMPILEAQIGIAGMLASAVPALCMFLVYGTSVAASGLATKLGGSDTINEKIASPDVVTPGAGLQMTSQAVNDFNGTRAAGSEANLGDMSMGSAMSKAVKSADSKMHSESTAMQSQAMSAFSTAYQNAKSFSDQASIGQGVQSAFGMSNDASIQSAISDSKAAGQTQSQIDAQIASLTAGASASGGVAAGGKSGNASASVSAGATQTSTQTHQNGQSAGRSASDVASAKLAEAVNNKLAKTSGRELAQNVMSSQSLGLSSTDTNSLMQQASKTEQSAQTFESASSFQQQYGYGENLKLHAFASNLMNQGRGSEVVNTAQSMDGSQYDQNYKTLGNMMYDDGQRSVAAAALTLAQTNNLDKIFGDGAINDSGRNSNLSGADTGHLDASSAGQQVDAAGFNSDWNSQNASVRSDRSAEGSYRDKAEIVRNDADVYRGTVAGGSAQDAEARIRSREREVSDDNESYNTWAKGGMNYLGAAIGSRGQASEYAELGRQQGLNDDQAQLFGAISTGDISNGRMAWNEHANNSGMDPELRDGMYNTIKNAALNDEGAAAGMQDVIRMNQADEGFNISLQSDALTGRSTSMTP